MSGDVIELATRLEEAPPLDLRERRWDECKHRHKVLVEETHRVACSDCGTDDLDPFVVLCGLAKEWRSWRWQWERLKKAEQVVFQRERASWERRRDRHLNAHPDHKIDVHRSQYSGDFCRTCQGIEMDGHRFAVAEAPKPEGGAE